MFAGGLSIPIGVTPIPGGVFGYSIPNLYRFLDKNGDGVADTREIAYSGFGHRDTHGMVNGLNYWLDGWVYCCHGYSNTSTVKGTDGSTITMTSGNTFRVRIDGSHVDQFSFGQVNPFGMTFDPRGDMFTADCHSRPGMLVLRGGCYQSFGRPHDGLGFAPEIMTHEHGSTGIAGIVYYTGGPFPAEYRDTIFLGNPVTGIINHDRITTHGSTHFGVELPDFLTCDDLWFRPGRLATGDRRLDLRGRLLQLHHRPLRGAADASAARQNAGPHLADFVRRQGRPDAAAPKMVDLSRASLETLIAVALERKSADSDFRDARVGRSHRQAGDPRGPAGDRRLRRAPQPEHTRSGCLHAAGRVRQTNDARRARPRFRSASANSCGQGH